MPGSAESSIRLAGRVSAIACRVASVNTTYAGTEAVWAAEERQARSRSNSSPASPSSTTLGRFAVRRAGGALAVDSGARPVRKRLLGRARLAPGLRARDQERVRRSLARVTAT